MKKKDNHSEEWRKVEVLPQYAIYRHRDDRYLWQIRLPKSGGYKRRRLRAGNLDEALAEAPVVAGLISPDSDVKEMSLVDAFALALDNSNRKEGSKGREDWWYAVQRFMKWLERAHPLCTTWKSLKRPVIRGYLKTMKKKNGEGFSANGVRLYMQPIVQTDIFMSDEYELPRITRNLKVGSKLKNAVGEIYIIDVLDFLRFLREHRPHIEVPVALTGLAGMSVMEVIRLTWSKVDLERGLVEISGEVKHNPHASEKHRERVIPVCGVVLDVLKRAKARAEARDRKAGVVSLDGHVVVGEGGNGFVNHDSYRPEFNRARKAWNPEVTFPPKDLRNVLLTFSDDRGIRSALWEEYTGHVVPGVSKKHYIPSIASRTRGQKEALEEKMGSFRRGVIEPLEEAIAEAQKRLSEPETCKKLATPIENAAN